MKSPVALENYDTLADSDELESHRKIVQQHLDSFPSLDSNAARSAAVILFPDFFEFNGHVIQAKDDYDREDKAAHDNIPFNKEFVLTRMETDVNLAASKECKLCVLHRSPGCIFAPCYAPGIKHGYFVLRRIEPAPNKRGKKEYVPDRPEDFDFSEENWKSLKAMVGM